MTDFFSTRQVAQILGIKPTLLSKAIWSGKVTPPSKGPSGNYLWTVENIEKAAWSMRCYRQFKNWKASQKGVRNAN